MCRPALLLWPPTTADLRPLGPPAPIKGAVIAACQRRPQAPAAGKEALWERERWRDKGSMKSCRNERGSFQSTVEMQRSFHAELKEMKERYHEGPERTCGAENTKLLFNKTFTFFI